VQLTIISAFRQESVSKFAQGKAAKRYAALPFLAGTTIYYQYILVDIIYL
jgi:hypothetical protein